MARPTYAPLLAALALCAGAGLAMAEYDRDGRYVPSPMGVPADPYARVVPGYPGTPGGAKGTPIWPRGDMPPPPPSAGPRPYPPAYYPRGSRPLRAAQCREGWNRRLGIPQVEFRTRCRLILKQQHDDDD